MRNSVVPAFTGSFGLTGISITLPETLGATSTTREITTKLPDGAK
ncbi:hypothetical protein [Bradyrhizobium sp. CCBAU 051011]|nr:hypothetical protein [Bradyrhizobium sp. CCBAU 051011]